MPRWLGRDDQGRVVDFTTETDDMTSPISVGGGGGVQTIRQLGPFVVNFDTAGVEDWNDAPGIKVADIDAGVTVMAAWDVQTIQFTGGAQGWIDLYLANETGDFAEIVRYAMVGMSQTSSSPMLTEYPTPMAQPVRFPVNQQSTDANTAFGDVTVSSIDLYHRITMAQEAAGLRVYLIHPSGGGAWTAGQFHVYALIAEPAA